MSTAEEPATCPDCGQNVGQHSEDCPYRRRIVKSIDRILSSLEQVDADMAVIKEKLNDIKSYYQPPRH